MGKEPTQNLRVLLVDDDNDVRETIKLVLRMERYEVVEAVDGRQALDLLKSDSIDLVVTDYVMPEMSGDLLAAEVKRLSPSTSLIMITANADLLPSPLPGVDHVLPKPFQVNDLISAIRQIASPSPKAE